MKRYALEWKTSEYFTQPVKFPTYPLKAHALKSTYMATTEEIVSAFIEQHESPTQRPIGHNLKGTTMATLKEIEQRIQLKNLPAPRVTLAQLEANIADVEIVKHVSRTGKVLRWAVLTTLNGFAATGNPSASVSVENDNAELGEAAAIENAKRELFPLMGYELQTRQQHQGDDLLAINRETDGYGYSPFIDHISKLHGDDEYDIRPLLLALGYEQDVTRLDGDQKEGDDVFDSYFQNSGTDISAWTPTTPPGEGWILTCIYDSDNGPQALFIRKKQA